MMSKIVVVSNSSTSAVGGDDELARMASVVVSFISPSVVVLSVTVADGSGEVER